jgi:hypothetical protein
MKTIARLLALLSLAASGLLYVRIRAPIEFLDYGLLSGLRAQSEVSELLEELYYDGLSQATS